MNAILPLLRNEGNRRLLGKWLAKHTPHEVVAVDETAPLSNSFDLCLIDGPALKEHRDSLKEHRSQARPEFIPVLLLVPREFSEGLTADVWEYVDDIIWTSGGRQFDSLDTFELEGRIRSLLRTRSMSRTLSENQQRLKVLHRLLRHNIRNSLTVINGAAEAIDDPEANPHVNLIIGESTRLLGHAEKAQDIDEIMDKTREQVIGLQSEVHRIVEKYRTEYPALDLELSVEESVEATAIVGITRAIEELIENAIRHNRSKNPVIRVRVWRSEGFGVVTVEDTGPPLQEQDRRVLRGDLEPTALDHGSGLGLWLVVWSVRRSGGTVVYQTCEPKGNRISIQLPIATS